MLVSLPKIFSSVQNSEVIYDFESNIISRNNGKVSLLVTPEICLNDSEIELFTLFLEAIDVDPEVLDNFGIATFQEHSDVFIGHCPAFIGLQKDSETENLELGLLIGSNVKNDLRDQEAIWVKITSEEQEVKKGKNLIKETAYFINGCELKIRDLHDPTDPQKVTGNQIYIETQDSDGNDIEFTIPALVLSDVKEQGTLKKLFKAGLFAEALREFGKNSNVYLNASEAFLKRFQSKTFPKQGVFFLVDKGVKSIVPAAKYQTQADIQSAQWRILGTSHPDLEVQYLVKNKTTGEKESFTCELSTATYIQFSSAKTNNEAYTFFDQPNDPKFDFKYEDDGTTRQEYYGLALIHVVSASSRNIAHNPVNVLKTSFAIIRNKLQPYPTLLELFENLCEDDLTQSRPALLPGVDFAKAKSDLETAPISWAGQDQQHREEIAAVLDRF